MICLNTSTLVYIIERVFVRVCVYWYGCEILKRKIEHTKLFEER